MIQQDKKSDRMTAEQIRQGAWVLGILTLAFLILGYLLGTEFAAAPSVKTFIIWMIVFGCMVFPAGYLAQEYDELKHRLR